MRIESVHVQRFRCIEDLSLTFEPGLTTLVGENGTGKSTISLAIRKLLAGGGLVLQDFPHGVAGPANLQVSISLSPSELEQLLVAPIAQLAGAPDDSPLHQWLRSQNGELGLTFLQTARGILVMDLSWGSLRINESQLMIGAGTVSSDTWASAAHPLLTGQQNVAQWEASIADRQFGIGSVLKGVLAFFVDHYKPIAEFRTRSASGPRSGTVESMTGSETASVLLTIKNHRDPGERSRYGQVMQAFKTFFPRYNIEAVEDQPGSANPEIQLHEAGYEQPLSLAQSGAGVQQMLTLLTNLVAREGLVIFLEHPESHLHPHAMRSLHSLLVKAAERNQLIVVTHSPQFVDPRSAKGLRRLWWTPEKGTQVCALDTATSDRQIAQIETALRHLGNREVVFARAVVLVEDESLRDMLCVVAPILGHDIDSKGISIIDTGGEGGHRPFHTLLASLGIPFVGFRDKPWNNDSVFPPERFFSLGASQLEEYLDQLGLEDLRRQVVEEVGGAPKGESHRRVAAGLARRLRRDQVPHVFEEVLAAAESLATSSPSQST